MPWISDDEYAQLQGGGYSQAPGTANYSPTGRTALGRAQQQLGADFQYDPQGNVWQPRTPFAASPAGANRLAGTLAGEAGARPGNPPPAIWRPMGGGFVSRDAGTGWRPDFGWGTTGPQVKLGPDGQPEDWRRYVTPERAAFLDQLGQQNPGQEFVPTYDAGGGYWRGKQLPVNWQQQVTAANRMPGQPFAPAANIQSQTPPTPAQAPVPSPKYNPYATGTPEQLQRAANPQSAPVWQAQATRAQAAVPPPPNAVVQQRTATAQQQQFQAAPTTGTGQPVLFQPDQGFVRRAQMGAPNLSTGPVAGQPIQSASPQPSRMLAPAPAYSPSSLTLAGSPEQFAVRPTSMGAVSPSSLTAAPEQFAYQPPPSTAPPGVFTRSAPAPSAMSGFGGAPLTQAQLASLNARRMA